LNEWIYSGMCTGRQLEVITMQKRFNKHVKIRVGPTTSYLEMKSKESCCDFMHNI